MQIKDRVLAQLIVLLTNTFKVENADFSYYRHFEYWQEHGFSLIPNHFYQPIPDVSSSLRVKKQKPSTMEGVNFNDKRQLLLLKKFAIYKKDFSQFGLLQPTIDVQKDANFYFNNAAFDGVDALVYYSLIKHLKPAKIIEIGSGWSTKIAATACRENGLTTLISIEPYPQPILVKGFGGLSKLVKKKIQKIPLDYFSQLKSGDILFIDSSHTVKHGGDVNYLFFEVIPRLRKGVYVHIHDIFFPFDYPVDWIYKEHRFWAEQYLLHAFLMFNNSFDVVYANSYMGEKYANNVKKVFSASPYLKGGSMWLKKVK